MTWEAGIDLLFQLLQASTGMSSPGRLVGKGKGSIAVEAVMLRLLHFAPPSIDSLLPTCQRGNDMEG